jgi:hypothetical protein
MSPPYVIEYQIYSAASRFSTDSLGNQKFEQPPVKQTMSRGHYPRCKILLHEAHAVTIDNAMLT